MRRKGDTALVQFELSLLAAAVSLRASGVQEFHGYALQEHLAEETGKTMPHGFSTLYRALRKLDEFGCFLHQAWEAKKRASLGATNPEIDRLYEIARSAGALGGKIAGAGGGGFLMVFSEDGRQQEITCRLESEGLFSMNFGFESRGATVLLNALATT